MSMVSSLLTALLLNETQSTEDKVFVFVVVAFLLLLLLLFLSLLMDNKSEGDGDVDDVDDVFAVDAVFVLFDKDINEETEVAVAVAVIGENKELSE